MSDNHILFMLLLLIFVLTVSLLSGLRHLWKERRDAFQAEVVRMGKTVDQIRREQNLEKKNRQE